MSNKYDGMLTIDREIGECAEKHGFDTAQIVDIQEATNAVVDKVMKGSPRMYPDGKVVKVSGLTPVEDTE